MTASSRIDHSMHLKQPACDYVAQGYEISHQLTDLIEALKDLLSLVEEYTKASHDLLDKGQIPVVELEDLQLCQIQGIKHLRQAAEDIEALKGFEDYSNTLAKHGVAHG